MRSVSHSILCKGEAAVQAKALLAALHESDMTSKALNENASSMNAEIVSSTKLVAPLLSLVEQDGLRGELAKVKDAANDAIKTERRCGSSTENRMCSHNL